MTSTGSTTVGVNGYGTVGKRVADAVAAQPDMTVLGVTKRTPSATADVARDRGYPLYVPEDRREHFERTGDDRSIAGTVPDLVAATDVVVDATPSGTGEEYRSLYERHDTTAIFQGGESADVAPASFNARANYDEAVGADAARVVSCNTTGLARLLTPLSSQYGIDRVSVTLVRRGGDPGTTDRGPIDDTVPDPVSIPSHHGPDLQTVLPHVDVTTVGLRVPTTQMHVQSVTVDLAGTPTTDAVIDRLREEPRVLLVPEHYGTNCGSLKALADDVGRPRGDVWENCVWRDSVTVEGGVLHCLQAIDQRAIVVPENVDAIRAVTESENAATSRERTLAALTADGNRLVPAGGEWAAAEPAEPTTAMD
jgi:glyceraldehyde-3-phosphate dehydrogenase (NAD(P))